MLKCFLVKLLTNLASCATGAAATAAGAAASTTAAGAAAVAPANAPTGISRSMSLPSPMWILRTPPATGAATGAAATGAASTTSSSTASSTAAALALTPSRTSAVSGLRESQVLISFAPKTSSIVRQPSRFNNPDSTKSSKIAGSSRFAASIVMPASALQHNTAGS
jgi:hypothetical protein